VAIARPTLRRHQRSNESGRESEIEIEQVANSAVHKAEARWVGDDHTSAGESRLSEMMAGDSWWGISILPPPSCLDTPAVAANAPTRCTQIATYPTRLLELYMLALSKAPYSALPSTTY
jgi:hypothetical protein